MDKLNTPVLPPLFCQTAQVTATRARNSTAKTGNEFVVIWAAGHLRRMADDMLSLANFAFRKN